MKLENHVVKKILFDPTGFTVEVIEAMEGGNWNQLRNADGELEVDKYDDIIQLCSERGNKNYYITKSVTAHLDLFDTKKAMTGEGWKIFKSLPDFKKTYILPEMDPSYSKYGGSGFLRVGKQNNMLQFLHVSCKFLPPEKRTRDCDSQMYIVVLYIDLEKNELCEHFNSEDGKSLAPMLYSLMCFIELTDNEVVIVQPKAKYGTKKSGKIINIFPFPITVVTNTWNVITIRSEGFTVSGHVHLFWTGPGRTTPLMKYVAPYQKEGYTRRSGKQMN